MEECVRENTATGRFELRIGDETAYADFKRERGLIEIDYVFAPPVLRGTGAVDRLMRGIVQFAREKQLRIRADCRFADLWLRATTHYRDLLADDADR